MLRVAKKWAGLSIGAAVLTLTASASSAALLGGADNAANYGGNWTDGSNGGTGFTVWSLSTNGATNANGNYAGWYIGDASSLPGGSTSGQTAILSSGVGFAMYGQNGATANGYRSLTSALDKGQTFSIDLAVNYRNGYKGIDINAGGTQIFNLNVGYNNAISSDDYTVNSVTTGPANGSLGIPYASDIILHVAMHQTSTAGGTWEVDSSSATNASSNTVSTGIYTGDVDNFHIYEGGTSDGNQANNYFVNNLAITPEPTSLSLLAGGGLLVLRRKRRAAR